VAGDVLADVPREGAVVNVVSSAGAAADQQADLLAAVELLGRLRERAGR
jgi:hypothetical protein